jgi:hypothetical protein
MSHQDVIEIERKIFTGGVIDFDPSGGEVNCPFLFRKITCGCLFKFRFFSGIEIILFAE